MSENTRDDDASKAPKEGTTTEYKEEKSNEEKRGGRNPLDATKRERETGTTSNASMGVGSSSSEESSSRNNTTPPIVVLVVPGKGRRLSNQRDTSTHPERKKPEPTRLKWSFSATEKWQKVNWGMRKGWMVRRLQGSKGRNNHGV